MTNQHYSFQSVWNIPESRAKVWQVMTSPPFSWDKWWPQLHDIRNMKVAADLEGTSFSCTWKAPLGYSLHSHITIGEAVKENQVKLHVNGDLLGVVTCILSAESGSTRVDIDWQVETTLRWMNRLTPVLRPVFLWGHHYVMRSGERGLRKHLQKQLH
jgi:hypothetical protein